MVQNNEFSARTLGLAVKKATAVYQVHECIECKDICSDLALDLADFKRAATDALNEAENLRRKSEALAQSARRNGRRALLEAALAAALGFGTAVKALRLLRRLKPKDLSRRDWISLLPVVGSGLAAGHDAYNAVTNSIEARNLAREAEAVEANADRLGDEIVRIANEYRRAGCNASDRTS